VQFHRLASLIIGLWLGASLFMDFTATQNFQTVDRVLTSLDLRVVETAKNIGDPEATRYLLRFMAGESNRYLFEQWEWMELAIGLALLFALLLARSDQRLCLALCLAMIVIVLTQRFYLTPRITMLGREMDFSAGASRRFAAFHQVYGGVEVGKLLLGAGIALRLILRQRASKKAFVREYEQEEAMRLRKA
jgi:hypothetical protein